MKIGLGTKKEALLVGCSPCSRISPKSNPTPLYACRQIKFNVDKAAGKPALFLET